MIRRLLPLVGIGALLMTTSCLTVKMTPVEGHFILDVNVRVDQALNNFFGDLDKKSAVITTEPKP